MLNNQILAIINSSGLTNLMNLPLEEELKLEMQEKCQVVEVEKNQLLAEKGKYMKVIPLVLDGSIRVYRQDYDLDREILLYYIDAGETCMMSLVASFADMISQVHARTERKSKLLLIPTTKVREWQIQFPKWNSFIIQTFLNRYTELLNAFNEVSFKKIDDRLLSYLRNYNNRNGDGKGIVFITHQELANELGTARVVISRLLKNMENEGLVTLKRGQIELKTN